MESVRAPKIAYVLGVYRSGTTLLSNLMGQLEGFFCVGELRAIWEQLGAASARCGCGALLIECDTWRLILNAAYGGVAQAQDLAPRMLQWQQQVFGRRYRWRRVPSLLRHRELGSVHKSAQRYADGMARLYRAIALQTGARVIVDSSKESTDAAVVRLLPDASTYFVHIVRDPRGTVFSSMRARSSGKATPRFQWAWSGYAAISWVVGNLAATAARRAHGAQRSLLIRYEDLADRPDVTLGRIAQLVGEPVSVPLAEDGAMVMAPTHTVSGNENRFRIGRVHIARDTAWQRNLKRVDRYVVTAIGAPLMMQYGYRLMP
jgi:hypothetical protein